MLMGDRYKNAPVLEAGAFLFRDTMQVARDRRNQVLLVGLILSVSQLGRHWTRFWSPGRHHQSLVVPKYRKPISQRAGQTVSLFAWPKSGSFPITETGKYRSLDTSDFNQFRKASNPMNGSLVDLNSRKATIRVREELRNQEVDSALMARKALLERSQVLVQKELSVGHSVILSEHCWQEGGH